MRLWSCFYTRGFLPSFLVTISSSQKPSVSFFPVESCVRVPLPPSPNYTPVPNVPQPHYTTNKITFLPWFSETCGPHWTSTYNTSIYLSTHLHHQTSASRWQWTDPSFTLHLPGSNSSNADPIPVTPGALSSTTVQPLPPTPPSSPSSPSASSSAPSSPSASRPTTTTS